MEGQKEKRSNITSCTECQRRKQKCSREWPCNHCQARRVPHLCHFGQRRTQQDSVSGSDTDSRGQKRSLGDTHDTLSPPKEDDYANVEDGLKAWGYMPGHVHYKLSNVEAEDTRPSCAVKPDQAPEVEKVLHAIPPRSITDAFVNHFLNSINHRYDAIYGPTFTEKYVQWWGDRGSSKKLSPEFTCLLLRILAYTVQYLSPELRKMVEFELACNSQTLTQRFGKAAEQLSATFTASETNIERVQEQFLKAAWLKSESKMVEAWHALSSTIREAQELGIDKDAGIADMSEFEIEIRRRLWVLLYVWDWQMSAWLGRPHLIDQKDCHFKFPNLRLDSESDSSLVSPFTHINLQGILARRIAQHIGDTLDLGELSAEQILSVEAECERFIAELPPIFDMTAPDLSYDQDHPYYAFQRYQLHAVIYMTRVHLYKPYLTNTRNEKSVYDKQFRSTGIDLCLDLLKLARKLFDHEFPNNAKFHLVVFCIFDTATLLCSAIIHDSDKVLPRRHEVLDAVNYAVSMLYQLSFTTKIGASSYHFLSGLVQAIPEFSRHLPNGKRQKTEPHVGSSSEKGTLEDLRAFAPTALPVETIPISDFAALDPPPLVQSANDFPFDFTHFSEFNPSDTSLQLDMGGLEHIWDWENLNLDAFLGLDNIPHPL